MNSKNTVLTVIAVALVGIFGILLLQYHEEQKSPVEKLSDSVSQAVDDVSDEINSSSN